MHTKVTLLCCQRSQSRVLLGAAWSRDRMCLGVTEVFRGLGGNPEIVGLCPKGRSVQCVIEAHRARGRRSLESHAKMNGEDVTSEEFLRLLLAIRDDTESELQYRRGQVTSHEVGQVQVGDRDKPIVDYELGKLLSTIGGVYMISEVSGSARRVSREHIVTSVPPPPIFQVPFRLLPIASECFRMLPNCFRYSPYAPTCIRLLP
ncbi:hypothetical protein BKA62DRAFT_674739 [Auriculariales sp. MPI-PUGE-AT-0066]|nr:hypothetical protein BKA62DRAFT_674739 [Auriculariales sp. MPI-PUGE-AT-0066]